MLRTIEIDASPSRCIDDLAALAVNVGGKNVPATHGRIVEFGDDVDYIWIDEDPYEQSAEDMSVLRGISLEMAKAALEERPTAMSFVVQYSTLEVLRRSLECWRSLTDLRVCGVDRFWTVDEFLSTWERRGLAGLIDPAHIAGWGDD